jgi:hypothetical protein
MSVQKVEKADGQMGGWVVGLKRLAIGARGQVIGTAALLPSAHPSCYHDPSLVIKIAPRTRAFPE